VTEVATYDAGKDFVALTGDGTTPGAQQVAVVCGADVPVITLELPPGLRGQAREQVARANAGPRRADAETTEIRPIYPPKQSENWSKVLIADAPCWQNGRPSPAPIAALFCPTTCPCRPPLASGRWRCGTTCLTGAPWA
jgi:hypothetical protein